MSLGLSKMESVKGWDGRCVKVEGGVEGRRRGIRSCKEGSKQEG